MEVTQNRSIEKQKVAIKVRSAVQKAEESRMKIESGSIERLRVAENRQEKKAESRSKKQIGEVKQKADKKIKQNREAKTRLEKIESP